MRHAAPRLDRRELLALLAGVVVCTPASARLRSELGFLFGSPIELRVPADAPASAARELMAGLRAIHQRWNAWKPGEVGELNRAFREGRSARASPALRALIRQAAWIESRSLGTFNAGIGGLVGAWGFHADVLGPGTRPNERVLSRWLARPPSLAEIEIDGERVASRNPRLQLDFGGIGKGAAIDRALDRLQARGIDDALLDLGGNLAVMGRAGDRPWRIGIRDPAGPELLATLESRGREAIVTSGSYERFRVLDGERAAHIVDPTLGRPAAGLVSVTVVHRSATLADAAATALLVAGRARWREIATRLGVDSVLVVDREQRIAATPSLASRLTLMRSAA